MSQENVEIVRRTIAAGAKGDFETVLALQDPEWEGSIPREYPLGGTYSGSEGLHEFIEAWLEVWEEFRIEPEQFYDGRDAVVVVVHYWGRGRGSGIEIEDRWVYSYRLRNGKIHRWSVSADLNEALEAAGLSA